MVKVKDTESFIRRAREKHGSRFDYSESAYVGSKALIRFRCVRCQRFVECRACDHIHKTKPITCGCHRNRLQQKAAEKRLKQSQKQEAREKLLARPCKFCGKPINSKDKKKVCCSAECGWKAISSPLVKVNCAACGKDVEKPIYKVRKNACCSNSCQKRLAAYAASNKPIARRRLPVLHACQVCGELRKRFKASCGNCRDWVRRLDTENKRSQSGYAPRDWYSILRDLANCNSKRKQNSGYIAVLQSENFCHITEDQWLKSLKQANKLSTSSMSWTSKLANMAGNHRQRMYRKSVAKRSQVPHCFKS